VSHTHIWKLGSAPAKGLTAVRATAWALPALLLLGACGGGSQTNPDRRAVTETVGSFFRAVAHGDGKTACALFAPAERAAAERVQAARGSTCSKALSQVATIDPAAAGTMSRATVSRVSIVGGTATASLLVPGASTTSVTLQRVGSAWRLTSSPAG
jgi:hypothetical protein